MFRSAMPQQVSKMSQKSLKYNNVPTPRSARLPPPLDYISTPPYMQSSINRIPPTSLASSVSPPTVILLQKHLYYQHGYMNCLEFDN